MFNGFYGKLPATTSKRVAVSSAKPRNSHSDGSLRYLSVAAAAAAAAAVIE